MRKLTRSEFIEKANLKHDFEYDYCLVEYVNNKTKVTIICEEDGPFDQIPANHLSGAKCPDCAHREMMDKQRKTKEGFVEDANIIYENKYNYDKVVYVNNHTKVIIHCDEHGDFEQTPKDHLNSITGCKQCGTKSRAKKRSLTTEQFLENATNIHGDLYDYSKIEYVNNHTKVEIICKRHDSFWQTPNSHVDRKAKCPDCQKEVERNLTRKTTEEFIEQANGKYNHDRYSFSKVVYNGDRNNVIIICKFHGEFEMRANSVMKAHECRKCVDRHKYTTEEFIEISNEIHENKYNYDKCVYQNNCTNVIINCEEHGDFEQQPKVHISRIIGCPKCSRKNLAIKNSLTVEEYIRRANIIHDYLYGYDKVVYVNSRTPIIITCKLHCDFMQTPTTHLSGSECPECAYELRGIKRRMSLDEFIERGNEIHDCKYKYDKVKYVNNHTKVKIKCPEHGYFHQTPSAHIHCCDECPKCTKHGYSKKALDWIKCIEDMDGVNIQHAENIGEFKIPGTKFRADGYDAGTNTVYEFHGCFFHGCPECFKSSDTNAMCKKTYGELYKKTINREKEIKLNGFNLVRIWEHEWNSLMCQPKINIFARINKSLNSKAKLLLNDSFIMECISHEDKILIGNLISVSNISNLKKIIAKLRRSAYFGKKLKFNDFKKLN